MLNLKFVFSLWCFIEKFFRVRLLLYNLVTVKKYNTIGVIL